MKSRYELLKFSTHVPVHCSVQQLTHLDSHYHDFFELILITEGQCKILLDGVPVLMNEGDLVAVTPYVRHELNSSGCCLLSVQFEQVIFEKTLPNPINPKFECNSALQGDNAAFDELRRLMAALAKNNADKQTGFELRNWSLVYNIMDVMYNNFRVDENEAKERKSYRYSERISMITTIISKHYTENFTLSMLAKEVHLSVPYLSKFFDRHFGLTFLAYLTQMRLNHAVDLLLHSEKSIEQISGESGFPNAHAFVQVFKREYNLLPSSYRRVNRHREVKKEEPALPELEQHHFMAGLKKYLETPNTIKKPEQVISKYISCDGANVISDVKHTWKNLMTVGTASDLLSASIREEVREMHQKIGFRYIKINDVFSDELRFYSEDKNGRPIYSFTYLDEIFDFLNQLGLKPFIQLGFMPRALAKDPSKILFNYLVSEPKDMSLWGDMVSAFTAHFVKRYGISEVNTWLFCPWHQPDTPNMYGFKDTKTFFDFFRISRDSVKKQGAEIPFGMSPTFYVTTENHQNWYLSFLDLCETHKITPDFLSFNYYDTVLSSTEDSGQEMFGFVQSMTLRDVPDGLRSFIEKIKKENKNRKELPIYLTEWNTSPSQKDLLNDTCFKSCYLVKNLLENIDALNGFGYWSLTDRMGEAPLPKELFFGGLGLFTANGIPKASFFALTLMGKLGNQLISKGDGWFLTKNTGGYQMLLYNYRHFSQLYANGERFDMTFEDRYTPFAPEQSMDFHLHLTVPQNGPYLIRETSVSRKYGNAFDEWLRMGGIELSTPEELSCLRHHATPHISVYRVTAKGHILELDAILDMLEIRLLEILPEAQI